MSSELKTNPLTMTRFLIAERMQFKDASGSFSLLLQSVQLACKVFSIQTIHCALVDCSSP
jgi:fructose-1,6-bisphosphatase